MLCAKSPAFRAGNAPESYTQNIDYCRQRDAVIEISVFIEHIEKPSGELADLGLLVRGSRLGAHSSSPRSPSASMP